MIILGIIFIIIGVILSIVALYIELNDLNGSSGIGLIAGGIFTLGITLLCFSQSDTPTAMDVYQGKTTLQYTIVDSVKVDSVVVWKSKMD